MRQFAAEIFFAAAIGFLLGLLGPFGTFEMPAAYRLPYWVVFAIIGYLLFRPVTLAATWLAEGSAVPLALCRLLAVALASLPMSWIVAFAMNGMAIPTNVDGSRYLILYLQVAGIGAAIYAVMTFLRLGSGRDSRLQDGRMQRELLVDPPLTPAVPDDPQAAEPALMKRLPPGFAGPVMALNVEDHYVRVHGAERSEMLLMRLGDAMDEMEPLAGMQVHRSWWVADHAVTGAMRLGRNIGLTLANGLHVPVSRAHVPGARARGWLENIQPQTES
ncbi:MAG: LytTR family DNA-binding domain-containing protein [Pseudomonadota bacterium]